MPTIDVIVETALAPEVVLEAARDFGTRRPEVFPAVEAQRFTLHDIDEDHADVTEGTGTGIGTNWERCDYDWSQPAQITATVTDSNVYTVGSSWHITATPAADGTRVEMSWVRNVRRSPRGVFFGTAFRIIGRHIFTKYGRQIIHNLESLEREGDPQGGQPR